MTIHLPLAAVTLAAAIVSGGLGYGFSSLTVPVALRWLPNRTLNPALVLVEVLLNGCVVAVNARAVSRVWRRVVPILAGLGPGIVAGTLIVSHMDAQWLKLGTLATIAPLTLIQAAGLRRPLRAERAAGSLFGACVGTLYASTTISGPPLAVFLNNQGLAREEFRAAIGIVRVVESTVTTAAYLTAGLVTAESAALLPSIVPSLVVGVPIGAWLIRRMRPEVFSRISMSFDAWVVAFALAAGLRAIGFAAVSTVVLATIVGIDLMLLARFAGVLSRRGDAARAGSPAKR